MQPLLRQEVQLGSSQPNAPQALDAQQLSDITQACNFHSQAESSSSQSKEEIEEQLIIANALTKAAAHQDETISVVGFEGDKEGNGAMPNMQETLQAQQHRSSRHHPQRQQEPQVRHVLHGVLPEIRSDSSLGELLRKFSFKLSTYIEIFLDNTQRRVELRVRSLRPQVPHQEESSSTQAPSSFQCPLIVVQLSQERLRMETQKWFRDVLQVAFAHIESVSTPYKEIFVQI